MALLGAAAAVARAQPAHPPDEGACLLRFDVDPAASTLNIAGNVLTPLKVPISQETEKAGLFGALYVQVNYGSDDGAGDGIFDAIRPEVIECPETGLDILTAPEARNVSFRFVSPPDPLNQGQLRVYPSRLKVAVKLGVTSFADIGFYDLALEILTYDFPLVNDPETNTSSFEVEGMWRIQSGIGSAVSAVLDPSGDPSYLDMAGLNTTVRMNGTFDWEGRKVVLRNPISAGFELKDGEIAAGVTAYVAFDTQVDATGVIGCPESCMLNGKCVELGGDSGDNSSSVAAREPEYGCLCKCGWSGEDCSIPSGYCSPFPTTEDSAVVIYQNSNPPSTWASGNESIVDEYLAEAKSMKTRKCDLTPANCTGNTVFNDVYCSCECQVGWTGTDCRMCTNNAACQIGNLGKECDTSLAYSNKTAQKEYSCVLRENDPVRDFLEGDIRTTCFVSENYCKVRLGSYSDSQPHVGCNVTECTFTEFSGHVKCSDLACECDPVLGCPEYFAQEIIDIMRNASNQGINAAVLCDETLTEGWVCQVAIDGLPVTVEGLCTQGQCISGEENVKLDPPILEEVSPPGLILALAGILGGIIAALGLFFLGTGLCRVRLAKILAKHGRYGSSAVSNILLPGSTFAFSSIKCTLASSGHANTSKVVPSWRKFKFFQRTRSKSSNKASQDSLEMSSGTIGTKSGRSRSAQHCSLEKFPEISVQDMKRQLSDSDLFKNLDETTKSGKKTILHSISGSLRKGLVMAIMGPSGSGKSTLLNILAGGNSQITNCKVHGLIEIDGQSRDQWFHKIAAHVPQEDNQIATLTVRECILYSAMLRLPWHWTKEEKLKQVDQVLKELGLKKVAGSQVGGGGGAIRGVSGGERRRVSIGMELVTAPKILFLDEPTSGLDSYTAASIMSTLTRLARNGRMVLLSLHQPSEAVFNELDKILLLARGHAVYCGDASAVSDYFFRMGFPCPPKTNIADHILEVVSKYDSCERLVRSKEEIENGCAGVIKVAVVENGEGPGVNMELQPVKRRSSARAFLYESGSEMTPSTRAVMDLSPSQKGNLVVADSHQPLDRELMVMFWRSWTDIQRHPALLRLHVIVAILVGSATAIIFQNVPNDLAGMQNRAGCLFFTLTFFAFSSLTTLDLFITERRVFDREVGGGYYRVGTYFLSKALLDGLVLRILPACLYSVIMYWAVGLRSEPSRVLVWFAALCLFNMAAGALSMLVSVVSPSAGFASLATIVALLCGLLFGGFLANEAALPVWLAWMQYCSIFYYAMEIMLVNEIEGLKLLFDAAGLKVEVKGDLFLDTFNFSSEYLQRDILSLFAIYVGLLLLAYLLLCWRCRSTVTVRVAGKKKG